MKKEIVFYEIRFLDGTLQNVPKDLLRSTIHRFKRFISSYVRVA